MKVGLCSYSRLSSEVHSPICPFVGAFYYLLLSAFLFAGQLSAEVSAIVSYWALITAFLFTESQLGTQ